jgi:protein TonB
MFEQSLLNDSNARKSGAFAASLSAQILFTGVLILMPLAYQEVLPLVKLSMPLVVPALSPPPPELPARTQSSSPMRARGPSHVFTAPPRVPPGPVRQFVDSFDDAPQVPVLSTGFSPFPLVNTGITRADIAEPVQRSAPQVSRGADPAPVRLGGVVLSALLIKKVIPVYPSLARQARISGAVHLEGILAKDGTIRNLQVLSGHPLLVPAALDAVRQWVYRPTLLNGVPVEVIAPIDVVFTLN